MLRDIAVERIVSIRWRKISVQVVHEADDTQSKRTLPRDGCWQYVACKINLALYESIFSATAGRKVFSFVPKQRMRSENQTPALEVSSNWYGQTKIETVSDVAVCRRWKNTPLRS